MRVLGYVFLIGGFLWLVEDVAIGFTEYQYVAWVGFSKTNLPAGDPIARRDAINVMRDLCLNLKDRHRLSLVPGCLMVVGGLMVGVRRRAEGGQ